MDDGTELVNKSPEGGPAETAFMNASAENAARTIPAPPPAYQNIPATTAATKRRLLLPWLLGGGVLFLLIIGGVIVLASVLRPRPALKWHLVMRVLPATGGNQGDTVNQTVSVISNRLNAAGVRFEIKPQGDQIVLDLQPVKDPERLKRLISTGGKLELVHVISPQSPSPVATYTSQEEAIASLNSGGSIPSDRRLLPYSERDDYDSARSKKWVVVESPALVSGNDVRDASAVNTYGETYDILFTLNRAGADRFGSWTAANTNAYMGVALNDEVKSIAYIKSQISDQGQITGNFTRQAAEDLALVLKSGALPARLEFLEERIDK
jgi:protein-export membrane protein SecD